MASSSDLLVLGATGQLGSDVVKVAHAKGLSVAQAERVDVTDGPAVLKLLDATRPRMVVNAAAFHQVDKCEDDPAEAFRVNAVGALHVARAARAVGARLAYVSTDYVFPGDKPTPAHGATDAAHAWTEADAPRPLNTYGASKLAGEHETRVGHPDALVARVASLFGVVGARGKGGNFIETILKKAREGGPLKVVNDQWMTPTYTMDAAGAILDLLERDARGVVHVTNAGAVTWHGFASRAVALAGLKVEVQPIDHTAFPSKAERPANSALHNAGLARALGHPLRPWPDALAAYLKEKGHI
ncbi:MAG: dTDP-4-dehydrorhamnose reductase [Thermoplasmata archaeon]|jgi:dTDP-4-dehydrorhamnose reductase|nr:dTDP-4-dehydrorhamnose reductase [Thermoplasmata archaeon]